MTENNPANEGYVALETYAETAYRNYAMSVVLSRALPFLSDGQKPVQRRILYDMRLLGMTEKAKPSKSARFVGDVLGKFHPHGDSSVYDAAVRMSQDFRLRYPLIDGHGNFGSRDGDGAAAMRYTEARLTPFADLLLGELDMGTVDFKQNFDGTLEEPTQLPARLPVLLLNGVSGIAVGMATEIPSHNIVEVANACKLRIENPSATLEDVLAVMPGPDFPCGGQIISTHPEIHKAYDSGRGPIRVRARWEVEHLARGQWQIAVTEIPPEASTASVMSEIEALINPKPKDSKKAITQEQYNLKMLLLSVLESISDDSDKDHPVRLVITPKSSRQSPDELMKILLARTGLEQNFSMNIVTIGLDGLPASKGLLSVLDEWIQFRFETVRRRTKNRLNQVEARIHLLEGRKIVHEHVTAIVHLIQSADSPKDELMATYGLSETQAQDVLEIRLRQLARLEISKLESELMELRAEEITLMVLLSNPNALKKQILKEIDADTKKYGDARRSLIEASDRVTQSDVVAASDEPITLIVSKQGWLRSRVGHKLDLASLTWRADDAPLLIVETRSTAVLVVLDATGRAFNVDASQAPNGRGDGAPISSLVSLSGPAVQAFILDQSKTYLLATSEGYGFLCEGSDFVTRQKAGKVLITSISPGAAILPPVELPKSAQKDGGDIAVLSDAKKMLIFKLAELNTYAKGKGMQLMRLNGKDQLAAVYAFERPLTKLAFGSSDVGSLDVYKALRARAGALLPKSIVAATAMPVFDLGDAVPTEPNQPATKESAS